MQPGSIESFPSRDVSFETQSAGDLKDCFWRVVGGESVFVNKITANKPAWVALEESVPGEMVECSLSPGETMFVKRGRFVASDANIGLSAAILDFTRALSGIGFAVLEAKTTDNNSGRLFFGADGSVVRKLEVSEKTGPITIDNKSIIAFGSGLS